MVICKESILLLHGIFRSKKHMRILESYLVNHGYEVININYPSLKHDLDTLASLIWKIVQERISENKKINFVGYSMGGLLARIIINKYKPENLGRVVLIGTPNKGSEIADLLKNNTFYKKFGGPAAQQLITDQSKFSDLFGKVDYEVGCIAGTLGIYPISSFLLKKKNDGRVSVESTKIKNMKDHISISSTHSYLPYSRKVHKNTLSFLQLGKF